MAGSEPLALGEKEEVQWRVPWEGPAIGEADSRAPDRTGGADPLVKHPEEVACPWVLTEYPIRDQLEGLERRSRF